MISCFPFWRSWNKYILFSYLSWINIRCPRRKGVRKAVLEKIAKPFDGLSWWSFFVSTLQIFPLCPGAKTWKNVHAFKCFQLDFAPKVLNEFLALHKVFGINSCWPRIIQLCATNLSSKDNKKDFQCSYCTVNPFPYSLFLAVLSELGWQCIRQSEQIDLPSISISSYISFKFAFPFACLNCHFLCLLTWEFSEVDFVLWVFELASAPPSCLLTYSYSYYSIYYSIFCCGELHRQTLCITVVRVPWSRFIGSWVWHLNSGVTGYKCLPM